MVICTGLPPAARAATMRRMRGSPFAAKVFWYWTAQLYRAVHCGVPACGCGPYAPGFRCAIAECGKQIAVSSATAMMRGSVIIGLSPASGELHQRSAQRHMSPVDAKAYT
jgi:hypothetical protein